MPAIVMLALYLLAGNAIIRWQLPALRPMVRWWLGCSTGLLLLMWLPALWAFGLRFSVAAHVCALGCLALILGAAYWLRDRRRSPARWDAEDGRTLRVWLAVILPLCVLGAVLQYTHVLRPEADGSYHVGQATYGDLNLHLGIATSLRNAAFPPEYSILPGTRLSYPFLGDSMSTSLLLFGLPLRWAIIVPGTLMMALVFTGYQLLAERILGKRMLVVTLAVLLFFLNGGLGFFYPVDMAGRDPSRFAEIFTGFYKTPANQPALNLRWSNVIADLMLPQRTLLAGWLLLLPALYVLFVAIERRDYRFFGFTTVFAAALPLVHTHSFLALGLCGAGWLSVALYQARRAAQCEALLAEAHVRDFRRLLIGGGLFLAVTLACTLPQLIPFAFDQTLSSGRLRIQLNWVNNSRNLGMIDGYLWFWIKNVGPAFLLLLCALLDADARRRMLAAGALAIYVVAEVVLFQENEYDNNKLFYVWYMISALLVADYAALLWHRLVGLRGRWVLAATFMVLSLTSGSLSIAREVVSDYELFSADAVACAEYVEAYTPTDALFMTGEQHVNPVAALTGRRVLCGTNQYLYFHGLNTSALRAVCDRFYLDPAANLDVLATYGITHILLSDYERREFSVDEAAFDALFPALFRSGDYTVYAVQFSDR